MAIKLENIGLGALAEDFDGELLTVIGNILDVNTDPKKAREINIKLKITPRPEDRELCTLEVTCSSKLASKKSLISHLSIGYDEHGALAAEETVPRQGKLFDDKPAFDTATNDATLPVGKSKIAAIR